MRWRSAAALTFVGLGVILIGAAPPSTPEQRIERWSRRVADRLDEMRVVGVDTEGYRAELRRARDLAEGEFTEEALLVLRTLVRDIEGWDPAPAPPRKPIEALRDVDRGPLPWAPEDRPVDDPWKIRGEPPSSGQPLPESAGYGSFRNSSRLRSRHHMVPEGEGARVVTDADRVGHRMRPSHIKAAHSAAARRTATWMEEADRVDGAVQGRPIRRSGGGTVLQREHGDPAAREPFTPAGHGMHDEDALPPDAVRPPAHTALALEGARGVGIYGGPRRQVRARIHPVETPDLPPRSDALTGEAGYGRYVPGATPVRPSRPVDFGTPPLATEMASAGGLDPDDLSADLGDAGDLGGDLGGDLDGDLGGGDLDGDLGGISRGTSTATWEGTSAAASVATSRATSPAGRTPSRSAPARPWTPPGP